MAFERSRAKICAEDDVKVTFADVAGIDEATEELREIVEFLRSRQRFLEVPGLEPEAFAEETERQIDVEIKQLVVEAHIRASDILRDRRSILGTLARRLIEQEVVEGAEVRALVAQASSSAPQAA